MVVVVVLVLVAVALLGGRGKGKRGRRSEISGKGSLRLSCRRSRTSAILVWFGDFLGSNLESV